MSTQQYFMIRSSAFPLTANNLGFVTNGLLNVFEFDSIAYKKMSKKIIKYFYKMPTVRNFAYRNSLTICNSSGEKTHVVHFEVL